MECNWPTRWAGSAKRITLLGDAAHAFFSESAMALEDAVVLIKHIQRAVEAVETSRAPKRPKGSKGTSTSTSNCVNINFEEFELERLPRVMRMHSLQDRRLVEMFTETGPAAMDKRTEQFMFAEVQKDAGPAAAAEQGLKMD